MDPSAGATPPVAQAAESATPALAVSSGGVAADHAKNEPAAAGKTAAVVAPLSAPASEPVTAPVGAATAVVAPSGIVGTSSPLLGSEAAVGVGASGGAVMGEGLGAGKMSEGVSATSESSKPKKDEHADHKHADLKKKAMAAVKKAYSKYKKHKKKTKKYGKTSYSSSGGGSHGMGSVIGGISGDGGESSSSSDDDDGDGTHSLKGMLETLGIDPASSLRQLAHAFGIGGDGDGSSSEGEG